MEYPKFNVQVKISISVPMIGDKSIMLLPPPSGFSFREIPFNEYQYKNRLIDGEGKIQVDYYFAVHGQDGNATIICLELEESRIIVHDKPANAIGFLNGPDFDMIVEPIHAEYESRLFQYFSMLHLFKEGEIARKQLFYTYQTQEGIVKNTRIIAPFNADMVTLIRHPMLVVENEVDDMTSFLFSHDKAYDFLKHVVIDDLAYTYHILDDITNYKNMVTPLEVMFLDNARDGKKEMLSKRMAVFLSSDDAEVLSIYFDMKSHYVDRSDAVHEGVISQITRASLNELRDLVRRATKKYIGVIEAELSSNPAATFNSIKANLISRLIATVEIKNSSSFWQ